MKRSDFEKYEKIARQKLTAVGIPILPETKFRISDYGLNKYEETGMALVTRINEPEYCSKWLVLLAGQRCPEHYHIQKKETFFCHQGEVVLKLAEKTVILRPGEFYTLAPGTKHSFSSTEGAIIEEISTHDAMSDSYFTYKMVKIGQPLEED